MGHVQVSGHKETIYHHLLTHALKQQAPETAREKMFNIRISLVNREATGHLKEKKGILLKRLINLPDEDHLLSSLSLNGLHVVSEELSQSPVFLLSKREAKVAKSTVKL